MSTVEVTGVEAVARWAPALDRLHAATDAPVTARWRWLEVWARHHPEWEPWLVAVGDGDDLAAAALLARRRQGPLTRVVELGQGPSDEARLAAVDDTAAEALATAVAAALDRHRPWTLRLEQLPPDSAVLTRLTTGLARPRILPGDPIPVVDTTGEADALWSKSSRTAERRAANKLGRADVVVTEGWTRDPDEIVAALPALSQVHRARDHGLGRRSDHDDPAGYGFYRDVVEAHARAEGVELFRLELDGALAAYVLAFRDGTALRVWDNRLSPDAARFSAGRLANARAVRHACADPGTSLLDWMRGDEAYKLETATAVHPRVHLLAFSGAVAALPWQARETAKRGRDTAVRLRDRLDAARARRRDQQAAVSDAAG